MPHGCPRLKHATVLFLLKPRRAIPKGHCIAFVLRIWATLLCSSQFVLAALTVDESKIPPAATIKVDFARDIKPIFDAECIRCHGPVKPKASFRLDNREAALKGG